MNDKPLHIALIADEYIDYPKVLVDNIVAECMRFGYGVLCVTGRELNPRPEFDQDYAHCNNVYQLLKGSNIAGLICLSGTIGNNINLDGLSSFLAQYPIPKVSFGMQLTGVPSVVVDDEAGMNSLMEHLVEDTDAKKFAFVRGYPNDPYSNQREAIFRRVLRENSIEFDESFLLDGNYDALDTYAEVTRLLKNHPSGVDAIVAANDFMALSVARAVRASGLEIPEDVIVSGFDDTEEATKHSPALTTVRQPIREMARLSVELLHEQIVGAAPMPVLTAKEPCTMRVHSELVVRGSTDAGQVQNTSESVLTPIEIRTEIETTLSGLELPSAVDLNNLVIALFDTLQTGSDRFGSELAQLIDTALDFDHLHWWNNLCFQLERLIKRLSVATSTQHQLQLAGEKDNDVAVAEVPLATLDHLLQISSAIAHTKEQLWQLAMEREYEVHRLETAQAAMQLQISSCSKLIDIINTLERWLDNINPHRCFLVSYQSPDSEPGDYAKLLYARVGSDRLVEKFDVFESSQILPDELCDHLNTGLLVLNPVFAGDHHYGYLLLDPRGLPAVDLFRTAISIGNAMRNQYLIGELEGHTKKLEMANRELVQLATIDVLTGLPNRYAFQTELRECCKRANRLRLQTSIFFLDLDGFKDVNDSLGHSAGDQLLQHVSERLKSTVADCVEGFSLIARLGGDEFTIVLEQATHNDTQHTLATALISSLSQPMLINAETVSISASIGFARQQGPEVFSDVLLKQADVAMYHAKSLGKNQYIEYSASMDEVVSERAA
ncbi:MAG: diguanylate cyclase [Gammaproteobacteria bacterium]|nr:diguanylate cyclase [Gammaproteobacteria bacterium]